MNTPKSPREAIAALPVALKRRDGQIMRVGSILAPETIDAIIQVFLSLPGMKEEPTKTNWSGSEFVEYDNTRAEARNDLREQLTQELTQTNEQTS